MSFSDHFKSMIPKYTLKTGYKVDFKQSEKNVEFRDFCLLEIWRRTRFCRTHIPNEFSTLKHSATLSFWSELTFFPPVVPLERCSPTICLKIWLHQYIIGSNYAPVVRGAEFILLNEFSLCGGEDFHLLENTTPPQLKPFSLCYSFVSR